MGFVSDLFGATNEYQAQPVQLGSEMDFSPMLGESYAQQANARKQQQGLADALLAASQGQGPSAAQSQFNKNLYALNRNIGSQMASQRGLNPALAAQLASRSQEQNMLGAVDEAAALKAQEQMAARNQLGGLLGNIRATDLGNFQGAGNMAYNQNLNRIRSQQGMEGINAQVAAQNANTNAAVSGGLVSGLSSLLGKAATGGAGGAWTGGKINGYAEGGEVNIGKFSQLADALRGAAVLGSNLKSALTFQSPTPQTGPTGTPSDKFSLLGQGPQAGESASLLGEGAPLPSLGVSTLPQLAPLAVGAPPMMYGGEVPGAPVVSGDHPANDVVPAWLSPGEIVIPRSIADDGNAAKAFVDAINGKNSAGRSSYGSVAAAKKRAMNCGGKV